MELKNSAESFKYSDMDDQLIGDGMVFTGYKNRHIGAIHTIQLPPAWRVASTSFAHGGEWMLTTFTPIENPKIELRIFCRGDKVTILDATYFSDLLKQAGNEVVELKPEHILSVKNVLGPTVGDNQYINQNPAKSRYAARCNLLSANIIHIKKRPVMMIEGTFTAGGADPTKFFNVYINIHRGGQEIQEVFFQAPILDYPAYVKQIKQALDSIKWIDL